MSPNPDIKNIDTSYDHLLETRKNLTWLPWIGKNFNNTLTKTLVLGESLYNWAPEDKNLEKKIQNKMFMRVLHQNHALDVMRPSKYVRNVERAIFLSRSPKKLDKEIFWLSVAYHNLVLRPMLNRQKRPTYCDYKSGWIEVFNLFEVLKISQCIVYGLEQSKINSLLDIAATQNIKLEHKKQLKIGKIAPKVITITINNRRVTLLFIRHPSAFFSWRNWGNFLQNENFHI